MDDGWMIYGLVKSDYLVSYELDDLIAQLIMNLR